MTISQRDTETLIELWREGVTGADIAWVLGISVKAMHWRVDNLRRKGVDMPRRYKLRVARRGAR